MKKTLSMLIALTLILSLTACGGAPAATPAPTQPAAESLAPVPAPAENKPIKIGVSLDTIDSQYWVSIIGFLNEKAKAENVELIQTVCEGDANKQNQQIEDLIAQGCEAILCGARDGASIVAAVKKCSNAGVPIVMLGRSVMGEEALPQVQVLVDNISLASGTVQWAADKARKEGKTYNIALLVGSLGDQNAVERREGAVACIEKNSDVLKLSAEIPTDWKPEQAFSGLQNAFQKDPSINLIIAPSDVFFTTIQSVLEPLGKWVKRDDPNHIAVIGFDGDDGFAKMMEEQYVDASAVNDTKYMAHTSLGWAIKLVKGEAAPAEMNMLDPGIIATPDSWETVKKDVWGYVALGK